MQAKGQNISPIKQRILFFVGTLGISKRDFYTKIGVSRGTLESKTGITEDVVARFIATYPEVNTNWLITGRGDMLSTMQAKEQNNEENLITKVTGTLHSEVSISNDTSLKPIPLVLESAVAGFGGKDFSIGEQDVKDYYIVPKFKHCHVDFMIEISGSSMYPKYNSGDIVACAIIRESRFIQWNRCHVIATKEQGILCKRLMQSSKENYITAVSDNDKYPPFDIPTNEITGIALVIGVIRLE